MRTRGRGPNALEVLRWGPLLSVLGGAEACEAVTHLGRPSSDNEAACSSNAAVARVWGGHFPTDFLSSCLRASGALLHAARNMAGRGGGGGRRQVADAGRRRHERRRTPCQLPPSALPLEGR